MIIYRTTQVAWKFQSKLTSRPECTLKQLLPPSSMCSSSDHSVVDATRRPRGTKPYYCTPIWTTTRTQKAVVVPYAFPKHHFLLRPCTGQNFWLLLLCWRRLVRLWVSWWAAAQEEGAVLSSCIAVCKREGLNYSKWMTWTTIKVHPARAMARTSSLSGERKETNFPMNFGKKSKPESHPNGA